MRGGSGRPARIKSRNMKKLLFTLLFCAAAAAAAGSEPAELKLLSYNIRYIGAPGDEGDFAWDARKEASIRMIRDVRPDVIGFQEPRRQQVAYLVEQLPEYGHIEMGRDFGAKDDPGEHLMIMYLRERYELLDHGHYWLSETPDKVSQGWDGRCRRVTVWARLRDRATGREFCLFDTHLDHIGKTARLEGARLNVERMRSIAGKCTPQFIVGDMNATAGTPGGVCLEPYFKWLKSACEEAPQTDPRLRQGQTAPHRPHLLPLRRTAALPAARQHGIRRAVSLGPLPDRLHVPLLTGRQCIHDKNRRNRFVRFLRFFIPDDARRKLSRSVQYRRAANTHAHRTIRRPTNRPTNRPQFRSRAIGNGRNRPARRRSRPAA